MALLIAVATISTDKLRRYVYLTFADTKGVTKIDYTLTYDSGAKQKGFAGGYKNGIFTSRSVRKQILGTCSSKRCVFHANPRNFQLNATLFLKSGGKKTITQSLP